MSVSSTSRTAAVSCIIPAWNAERFLGEAIDSVLAQTLPAAEVIVVDDGSTDGTAAVARRYDGRVRLIEQANGGTAAARDAGIRAATCDLFTFLDADDLFLPEKIERQLAHLRADDTIDVSVCHASDYWDDEVPAEQRAGMALDPGFKPGQMGTWLIRRRAFDRFGLLCDAAAATQGFSEASSWYLAAKGKGLRVAELPETLMHRRLHLNNKTRQGRANHLDAILALAKRTLDQRKKGVK
ncbi:MAG: glycosyltransferase family 2 protein [Phycisphaeraceae bacterium]